MTDHSRDITLERDSEPKRRKIDVSWLDLEASVADDDEDVDEVEEQWELDDEELDEPEAANSVISHAQLTLEYDHASETIDGWDKFLQRAISRVSTQAAMQDESSFQETRTFVGRDPIWKIPVKVGWEEILAFKLFTKKLGMINSVSTVLSITGRVSAPGFILVEGGSSFEIDTLAAGIDYVFAGRASIMPPELVVEYYSRSRIWTPHCPGWVRLTKFPYNGDLAYVYGVDERTLTASVLTVPRVDYTPLEDRSRLQKERPEKAFFNAPAVRVCFGQDAVEKRNAVFLFQGDLYDNGFLQFDTNSLVCRDAEPTEEELFWFHQCPVIPRIWIHSTFDRLRKNELENGNKVRVLTGDYAGSLAVIQDIEEDAVIVTLSNTHENLTVNISQVRKYVSVGDQVRVTAGPHARFVGWVVAIANKEIRLFNHDIFEEIVVPSPFVEFWSADFVAAVLPAQESLRAQGSSDGVNIPVKGKSDEVNDLQKKFVGKHVVVIYKSVFKGYRGIIKEIQQDSFAVVELNASLRRVRLRLSNLAMTDDPKKRKLSRKNVDALAKLGLKNAPYVPTSKRPNTPLSSRPLQPSTPLPTPLSGLVSPAWDPSSQTPDIGSSQSALAWMVSPFLCDKRIKVQLLNTKPVLRDPGFKLGDYEEKIGQWTGTDQACNAKVTCGWLTLSVPLKYIKTFPPTIKSQTVVAIKGPFVGGEYIITEVGSSTCRVKPRRKGGIIRELEIETSSLVVIA